MEDLFSESDLDQEMLEKEKQAEKALIEKKIESEKKEIEEAKEDMNNVQDNFLDLWKSVKRNSEPEYHAESIYFCAVSLACEAIQVATMAQKFIESQKARKKNDRYKSIV